MVAIAISRRARRGAGRTGVTAAAWLALVLGASGASAQSADDAAMPPSPETVEAAEEGQPVPGPDAGGEAEEGEEAAEEVETGLGRAMPRPTDAPAPMLAELDAFESALSVYEDEILDYRATIQHIVEGEYFRRRTDIREFFDGEIDILREEERLLRESAIADLQAFLARYPNHPEYTPDVVFRLAELYYERSLDRYNEADLEYDRALRRYDMGIEAREPQPPEKNFDDTIGLFNELMRRFPEYRQLDGAYYLRGVCHEEMFELQPARESYMTLVQEYPNSPFAQEAWLRIGEFYFDDLDFRMARAAYQRALQYGESNWYDKILFKLGWATYLLSEYDEAITQFRSLLAYYDREGDGSEAALKQEAMDYFAISLAEEDWNLDGNVDPDFILPRVQYYLPDDEARYTPEVLTRLAEILVTYRRFTYAIEVYEHVLGRFPLDRENPYRHEQIVAAYTSMGDADMAMTELRRLGELYAPGTPWFEEQERLGNTEAMEYAEALARESILESAGFYYLEAESARTRAFVEGDPALEDQAREQFRFAARLYAQFLEQYPNVDEAYDSRMYLAQALMNSDQYLDAAAQYALVRESQISDEYLSLAASQAIVAYERELARQIDLGELEPRAWPAYAGSRAMAPTPEAVPEDVEDGGSEREEPLGPPAREPIPELSLAWSGAVDRYWELGVQPEDDPNRDVINLFASGKLYYDYKHYDEARARFVTVLDACRDVPQTAYSAALVIESYAAVNDVDALRFWSQELSRRSQCVPENLRETLAEDLDRIAMGEMAQRAEELAAEERYEEAALEYIRLSNEYADNVDTAPLGLFNAGLIYEQELEKYPQALDAFERLVTEYPDSEWVDDALVRIAVNSKKFFDFDRAIETFLTLHAIGFSDPELVEYPLLDAAQLMEYNQRYVEAADAYLEFVDDHPEDERAPLVVYQAGTLYQLAGELGAMERTFDRFRSTYGNWANTALIDIDAAYIDTLYRQYELAREDGDTRARQRLGDRILEEYTIRQPSAVEAGYAAGDVAYSRALVEFDAWNGIVAGESQNEQVEAITDRINGLPLVLDEFAAVADYGSADWTVCALFMRGRTYQEFADMLFGLPMPDFGGDFRAEDEYIIYVEEIARPVEDDAIYEWEQAYPVMQSLGIVNECTIVCAARSIRCTRSRSSTRRWSCSRRSRLPCLRGSMTTTTMIGLARRRPRAAQGAILSGTAER